MDIDDQNWVPDAHGVQTRCAAGQHQCKALQAAPLVIDSLINVDSALTKLVHRLACIVSTSVEDERAFSIVRQEL